MFSRITLFFFIFAILAALFHIINIDETNHKNKEEIIKDIFEKVGEKTEQETNKLELDLINSIHDIGTEIKN